MAERQSHWPIVQRQDSGFWYQLSRFESWWASHCSFRQTPFGEFLFLKRGRSCRLNLTFVARIRLNPAPLHECPGSSAAARMQPPEPSAAARMTSRIRRCCASPATRAPHGYAPLKSGLAERTRVEGASQGRSAGVPCKNHPSNKLPLEKRSENGGQGKLLSKIRSAAGPSDAFLAHFSAFEFSDLRKRRQVSSLDATWAQLR